MKRIVIFILVILSVAGCTPMTIEQFADDSKEAIANQYIEALLSGNFETLQNDIEPSLKPGLTHELLEQMQQLLGTEEPKEKNLIGYNAHTYNQGATRYNLTYQYGYGEHWIVWNIAFRTLENGRNEILGLNVYNPMQRSLQDVHRFELMGKGTSHYLFLVLCASIPAFILITLIVAIRTKLKRRKWLWIIFILLGLGKFSLNWTTGQMGYQIFNIHLLGSGVVSASIYAPWILSFSIPLGALMFWAKRKELRKEDVQPVEDIGSDYGE